MLIDKIQQVFRHSGFRKYFLNTGWLMADKILSLFAGLFVGVYVARYLGPERFGLLNYAISFVGLFTAFATLGLDNIVMRNLVQNIEDRDRQLGTAFILKLLGGILFFGAVAFAVRFTSSDSYTKLLIYIIAGGMIFESLKVIDFYFQSQVLGRFSSIAGICALCLSSILRIALVFFQVSLIWFAVAQVFSTGILALMLLFFYFKHGRSALKWNFDWSAAKELLRDSWPLILSGLVIMIYMRIDQVMIKEMLDSEAVGNYAVAVRLSEAWYFIPMSIANSLFPAILSVRKISEDVYYKRLQRFYDLMVLISVSIAISMTFLSSWLISVLYGEVYSSAALVLSIHIWSGVFVFIGVACGKHLLAENLQRITFYRTGAGAIINVLLNILLIPKYNIAGAAVATLISQIIASYLGNIISKKTMLPFLMQSKALFGLNIIRNGFKLII